MILDDRTVTFICFDYKYIGPSGKCIANEAIVFEARGAAEALLDDDPDLLHHRQLREEVQDLLGDAVDFLFKS